MPTRERSDSWQGGADLSRRAAVSALLVMPLLARPARAAESGGTGIDKLRQATRPLPAFTFTDEAGAPLSMADYAGRAVVLNLWATWCPPCVAEMPSLDRLSAMLRQEGFSVLALSSDRGGAAQVRPFYERVGVLNLAVLLDPRGAAARMLGARGLPTTVIIDRRGQEVARLEGEARWDSPAMLAALRQLGGAAAEPLTRT